MTVEHPRYELIDTGDVYDGPGEVARYFEETRAAFPDQRNELIAMHHSDDAVIVEATSTARTTGRSAGCRPRGESSTSTRTPFCASSASLTIRCPCRVVSPRS